jgi:hypothetical protein
LISQSRGLGDVYKRQHENEAVLAFSDLPLFDALSSGQSDIRIF